MINLFTYHFLAFFLFCKFLDFKSIFYRAKINEKNTARNRLQQFLCFFLISSFEGIQIVLSSEFELGDSFTGLHVQHWIKLILFISLVSLISLNLVILFNGNNCLFWKWKHGPIWISCRLSRIKGTLSRRLFLLAIYIFKSTIVEETIY